LTEIKAAEASSAEIREPGPRKPIHQKLLINRELEITANDLCRDSNLKLVDELINDQLKLIEDQIRDDHSKHKSSTIFETSDVFIIENMTTTDIQLMVYGQIIEELEDKGFDVSIKFGPNTTFIYIKWHSKLDEDTKIRYSQLIEKHKIKDKNKNEK